MKHEKIVNALVDPFSKCDSSQEKDVLIWVFMRNEEDEDGKFISVADRIDILAQAKQKIAC